MAIIYYPTSTTMTRQDSVNSNYTQLFLTNQPNTIFVFDNNSNLSILSSSVFYLTSSNCISASYSTNGGNSNSLTSSYISQSNVKIEDGKLWIIGDSGSWFQITVSEPSLGVGVLTLI